MEPVIARLKRGKTVFEILVYPKEALEFKKGKALLEDALVSNEIYIDLQAGKKAPEEDLRSAFRTENKKEAAKAIISEGEVQIPKSLRDEIIDKKKRKIAAIISKNGVNPQTGLPHPPERILGVIEKCGANIDFGKSAEDQVQSVIEKIRLIIPISIEQARFELKIPVSYSRMAYGKIKALGKIVQESWNSDGSFSCILEIPAGQKNEVYDVLGRLTKGEAQILEKK
jgi:ribosome maturation protein SDO1